MTLPEFLMERLAEDEWAAAKLSTYAPSDLALVGAGDPARTLRDVASKRWIVASLIADDEREPAAQWMLREVCKALASVYADHEDYREEWRS